MIATGRAFGPATGPARRTTLEVRVTAPVFAAVMLAALLHAGWNALVKTCRDTHLAMTAVVLGQLTLALPVLAIVPWPARESWAWLGCGLGLHLGYQLFLLTAYRIGDLGQVYPLARGSAPLVVTFVSVLFLGERLAPLEILGVGVIAAGILGLGIERGGADRRAVFFALGTGMFIAAFTLVDGIGARLSGSPVGYFAVNCLGNAALFGALVETLRAGTLGRLRAEGLRPLLLGGPAAFVAYAITLWAFTQAPIALVAALRETSIAFALAIGVIVIGETAGRGRILAAGTTLAGAILLRIAA